MQRLVAVAIAGSFVLSSLVFGRASAAPGDGRSPSGTGPAPAHTSSPDRSRLDARRAQAYAPFNLFALPLPATSGTGNKPLLLPGTTPYTTSFYDLYHIQIGHNDHFPLPSIVFGAGFELEQQPTSNGTTTINVHPSREDLLLRFRF